MRKHAPCVICGGSIPAGVRERVRSCSKSCTIALRAAGNRKPRRPETTEQRRARFETHFAKASGCWNWNGANESKRGGYGLFWMLDDHRRASRVAYEIYVGPIPAGLHVLHKCDNPPCVNPDHLFVGTPLDNARDCSAKGRRRNVPSVGEKNGLARLTNEQARQIKTALTSGAKGRLLAKMFSVSESIISDIKRGKTWTRA